MRAVKALGNPSLKPQRSVLDLMSVVKNVRYLYLIIDWEGRESRTGPLRAGLRVGTDGLGQYKTPGMPGFLRAQRGRARSALLWRVDFKERGIFNSRSLPIPQVCRSSPKHSSTIELHASNNIFQECIPSQQMGSKARFLR